MSLTTGVRAFRKGLTGFIDQPEPVIVTRRGRTVGLFIPVHHDRSAELAAFTEAAEEAAASLAELGMTEDEAVAEFEDSRRAAASNSE